MYRPQLCGGKEGKRERKRRGVSLSRLRGLLSAAALSSLCALQSPVALAHCLWKPRGRLESYPWVLQGASPENDFPVLPVLPRREMGKGVPGVLSSLELCTSCSKEKTWAILSKLACLALPPPSSYEGQLRGNPS